MHKIADEYGVYSLTLDGATNSVNMDEEKGRFRMSKTGVGNIRICRDAGSYTVPAPGKYKITLSGAENGCNLPVSEIRFKLID